jgi:DNA-directed RNA polymerase beta subunit
MLNIPSYQLRDINVFNFRETEWDEEKIINTVARMLEVGEKFNLRVDTINIKDKEDNDLSEIKKTKSKILEITLLYTNGDDTEAIELKYDIPWLINNHFYISGNYKVAIYQLFDKPVIKRKDIIKIRTNIQSIMLKHQTSSRRKYNYQISLFGKKYSFARLIIAFFGVDGTRERFNLDDNNDYTGGVLTGDMEELIDDIKKILNDQSIDKVKLLESIYIRRTDENVLNDLSMILEIDIFSKKYFQTDSIVEEYLYALENEINDDCDYHNKRVRFVEQIIYVHLCKDFYNLINSVKKNRKVKFSVNSKNILSNVNVSNIVQFDNSLNPLSELALLSRTSLSGPGGFEKQNIPVSLREIHPSMKYLIDPADTADREGCGSTQYLVPNANISEDGSFFSREQKNMNSIAISFVPFLEHDDATRLQMASSQQRHAIMLKNFDVAMIQSGVEGMYSDQTSFIFRAKRNGKVIYLDKQIIMIQYDNKACDAFYIGYRKLYISTVDFYKVYYNVGDEFTKGSIIAETNYMSDGRITLGKNCLACITPWYGYNYEDGIVISQKMVDEDYFTSVHYTDLVVELGKNKVLMNLNDDYSDYKPLPEVGDIITTGDIYAKVKSIDTDGFDDVLFEPVHEHSATEEYKIVNVKVYANKWNKAFPQFDEYIQNKIAAQKNRKTELVDKLSDYLIKDELNKIVDTLEINQTEKNNYKIKGNYIDGVRIEITAVYERKIEVGDKLGNRHGNKGVISNIVPENEMPMLPDGRRSEIIVNPLGITSRMNVGQVYELHLTMSLNDLKIKVKEMYDNGNSDDIYPYIIEYIKLIDNTESHNYTSQMVSIFEQVNVSDFVNEIDRFFLIQPPFESVKWEDLNNAMEYTNTPYEYELFEPMANVNIQNTIACGYMYWFKLNHIAKDKISFRGTGPYSVKTSQPLGGKSRKGGQRLGEMEIWAIIAHGDELNLKEFSSTKSDSIKLRNQYISEQMCNSDLLLDSDDDEVPQSLRLLQTNLKSLACDYELNDGVPFIEDDIIDIDIDDVDLLGDVELEKVEVKPIEKEETGWKRGTFEIGGSGWGDEKIKYNVSDPDAIPDQLEIALGDDDIEGIE